MIMFKKLLAKFRGLPPVIPPELKSSPPEGVTDDQWQYIQYLQRGIRSGAIPSIVQYLGKDSYGSKIYECEITAPRGAMTFTYLRPYGMDLWCLWKQKMITFDEAVKVDYNELAVIGNNIDEVFKETLR